ncbi:MAG: hypothetical protein QXQ87_04620 [Halobacteria archaeon]
MTEKTWVMWTLSEGDIDDIADRKLTEEQKEEVARRFQKFVECCLEKWDDGLSMAINDVLE